MSTGQLKEGEGYDVDFDHQFIEAEKFDAKPTYKKFLGLLSGSGGSSFTLSSLEEHDTNEVSARIAVDSIL